MTNEEQNKAASKVEFHEKRKRTPCSMRAEFFFLTLSRAQELFLEKGLPLQKPM